VQPLLEVPTLIPYFASAVRGNLYPAILGYVWLNSAELLFAAFAIVQVARWAAEDADGRLELVLSQPRSRPGVIVERIGVTVVAAAAVAAVSAVAVFYASRYQGIALDPGRLATASLMLVLFALAFASAGALLVAWRPRLAVGALGGLAFLGFLDTEVGGLFKFPAWVQDLSPFQLFGTPLVTGLDARNAGLMLMITIVGVGTSILAIQRRDIGT
jgi:ABC-2 type transport system permease protein